MLAGICVLLIHLRLMLNYLLIHCLTHKQATLSLPTAFIVDESSDICFSSLVRVAFCCFICGLLLSKNITLLRFVCIINNLEMCNHIIVLSQCKLVHASDASTFAYDTANMRTIQLYRFKIFLIKKLHKWCSIDQFVQQQKSNYFQIIIHIE